MRKIVVVTIEVETNLDDDTLDRRIESLLDPARLASELLGDERVEFRQTVIDIEEPSEEPGKETNGASSGDE